MEKLCPFLGSGKDMIPFSMANLRAGRTMYSETAKKSDAILLDQFDGSNVRICNCLLLQFNDFTHLLQDYP